MKLNKWNYAKHKYVKFDSPVTKKPDMWSNDMEEIIECANCGKELKRGETFTSRTIHTNVGFGYPVCGECYDKEMEEHNKAKQEELEKDH